MSEAGRSREHQANERTFLAWVRTAIALTALGFVVVKFSLFLKELPFLHTSSVSGVQELSAFRLTDAIGIALVAIGGVMCILAYIRYRKVHRQLLTGQYEPQTILPLLLLFSVLLVVVSLTVYLLFTT
jgi:putative membrane protein